MKKLILFIFILFAFSFASKEGDMSTFSGQIIDSETLQPLAYCNIYFEKTNQGASSKRDGSFVIKSKPGNYKVVVQRIGYKNFIIDPLVLNNQDSIYKKIYLLPVLNESEAVIVTASLKEQTSQMAPANVDIISRREIEKQGILTFDQILESASGITVYRSAGISVQSLSIRGSSDVAGGGVGNRVLLLIDGRPSLSSDTGGALWSLVPTNIIDHIEVLKGPFSSLYGSTALGGVVNVITKKPAYRRVGSISIGYGLYETAHEDIRYTNKTLTNKQIQFNYSGITDYLSYVFSAGYKTSDGHSQNSRYRIYNLFSKFIYDLQENRYLEMSIATSQGKNDYPHSW